MSAGHPEVEPIMGKLDSHIKEDSEHYNPIYSAFQELIEKFEQLEANNKRLKDLLGDIKHWFETTDATVPQTTVITWINQALKGDE